MTMNGLIREIYKVILRDVAEYCQTEKIDLRVWEKENRERVEYNIRKLLISIAQPEIVSVDPQPISPPDWQLVHIGEGVFVPTKNPELECEITWREIA